MKKLLTILLTLLLSINLFGCGSKKTAVGNWYNEKYEISVEITENHIKLYDSTGYTDEADIKEIMETLIELENGTKIDYSLTEDGKTLTLDVHGRDVDFIRK